MAKILSYKAHLEFFATVNVTPAAAEQFRKWAKEPDATPFLRLCNEQHPEDDDAFCGLIVKNALRGHTRDSCVALIADNGLGGRVSPVKIQIVGKGTELIADLVPQGEPQVIEVEKKEQ